MSVYATHDLCLCLCVFVRLIGHQSLTSAMELKGNTLVSGNADSTVKVCVVLKNLRSLLLELLVVVLRTLILTSCFQLAFHSFPFCEVWDVSTGYCLHTLHGPHKHQSAVTSLQFTENFVVTSSDDGRVKLWDIKTGEFIRDLIALDSGGNGMAQLYCSDSY